jgi:hypothetical protein
LIIAAVSFFADKPELLQRCLESLSGFNRVIAAGGPYADWPKEAPRSNEKKCLQLVDEFGADLIYKDGWEGGEAAKREACFLGSPGDWYLLIDADEEFVGDVKYLEMMTAGVDRLTAFMGLRIYRPASTGGMLTIWHRLFRHLPVLHYQRQQKHPHIPGYHDLQDADGNRLAPPGGKTGLENSPYKGVLCPIAHFVHYRDKRSDEEVYWQGIYLNTRKWN